jgi:uncharacterized membrane protein YeaQ/YmgE (transglycosylase-associated protein family)
MSIIGWLVLGLIAGFVASKIVNAHGEGVLLDIVLGMVGAVVGGFIFNAVGEPGVTGLNLWSFVWSQQLARSSCSFSITSRPAVAPLNVLASRAIQSRGLQMYG